MIAGDDFTKLLKEVDEPYRMMIGLSTTLNIYTHVVDASQRQAIEAVERQLFPTVPKSQQAGAASASETPERADTHEAPAAASERRREVAREPAYSGLK